MNIISRYFFHVPRLYALGIAFLCSVLLILTIRDSGVTWDETGNFEGARSYFTWLLAPSIHTIETYWKIESEHPPLQKIIGGLTWHLFHNKLNWLEGLSAYRLSLVFYLFPLIYGLFRFSTRLYNIPIAAIVTISFFFMPRIFYHAHLGVFDFPVLSCMFLAAYGYWKSRTEKLWIFAAAVFLGLGFLTKISVFFIYLPITFLFFLDNRYCIYGIIRLKFSNSIIPLLKSVRSHWPIIVIPPLMFVIFWPWLWDAPLLKIWEYFQFHKGHFGLRTLFLGEYYNIAPWYYPFVMTFVTTPVPVILTGIIGLGALFFHPEKKTHLYLVCCFLLPIFIVASPGVPKYDGVRLFLPSFPFLCMLSGTGIWWLCRILKAPKLQKVFLAAYSSLFLILLAPDLVSLHPHEIVYYNGFVTKDPKELAGRFELDYWGGGLKEAIPWIVENKDKSYCVPLGDHLVDYYRETGIIPDDISIGFYCNKRDYLVLLVRQGQMDEDLFYFFTQKTPVYTAEVNGLPLVNIYSLKKGR